MKKIKNIRIGGLSNFLKKPWNVLAVLLAFFVLACAILAYKIYTKDQPSFIPEDTRESTRGAIVEKIAEPLGAISKPLSTFIVGAAYQSPKAKEITNWPNYTEAERKEEVKKWPTYTDIETGISVQYPIEWVAVKGELGASYFVEKESLGLFNERKRLFPETKIPYWGGVSIGLEVQEKKEPSLDSYVKSYLGEEGISKEELLVNNLNALRVIDKSKDRYGGGIGYFYFIEVNGNIVTLFLDYFGEQEPSNEMLRTLSLISLSVK